FCHANLSVLFDLKSSFLGKIIYPIFVIIFLLNTEVIYNYKIIAVNNFHSFTNDFVYFSSIMIHDETYVESAACTLERDMRMKTLRKHWVKIAVMLGVLLLVIDI